MVTPEPFERYPDVDWSVMTRLHTDFGTLVRSEQNRALLVFDSSAIQSELAPPFAHEIPEGAYDGGARMERLAEAIMSERHRAQDALDRLVPQGGGWIGDSHDTRYMVTPEPFERYPDGDWSVMTRLHPDFGTLVRSEQNRALLVFDSSTIQS